MGKKFVWNEKFKEEKGALDNHMDNWIIAANYNLLKTVEYEMDHYLLYKVVPKLLKFLEQLSNWYVRLNRSRIKGETGIRDWTLSLNVLFEVLLNTSIAIAPFVPFITELIYQNLQKCVPTESKTYYEQSIHFLLWPEVDISLINKQVEISV